MIKIVVLLIAILFISACVASQTTGNLIVGVKDHPKQIGGIGNVSAIDLTVKSIQIHRSGGGMTEDNETGNETVDVNETNETDIITRESGWITVFEGSKTFNLLDFTGNAFGILGNTTLDPGRYQQIRLFIETANVTVDSVQYPLRIPSKALKIVRGFEITANETTILVLDFDVEKSVKKDNNGYRLKPTIKLEKFKANSKKEREIENEIEQEIEEIEED